MFSQFEHLYSLQPRIKATWFLSLCLLVGIPGFGIGTALWSVIYVFFAQKTLVFLGLNTNYLLLWALLIALSLLILSYALLLNYKKDIFQKTIKNYSFIDQRLPVNKLFYISPLLIALITLIIPLATFYVSSRVLS